ncbi:hypothetical protein T484DRAFT_1893591, partial [Baffinella frigidus]
MPVRKMGDWEPLLEICADGFAPEHALRLAAEEVSYALSSLPPELYPQLDPPSLRFLRTSVDLEAVASDMRNMEDKGGWGSRALVEDAAVHFSEKEVADEAKEWDVAVQLGIGALERYAIEFLMRKGGEQFLMRKGGEVDGDEMGDETRDAIQILLLRRVVGAALLEKLITCEKPAPFFALQTILQSVPPPRPIGDSPMDLLPGVALGALEAGGGRVGRERGERVLFICSAISALSDARYLGAKAMTGLVAAKAFARAKAALVAYVDGPRRGRRGLAGPRALLSALVTAALAAEDLRAALELGSQNASNNSTPRGSDTQSRPQDTPRSAVSRVTSVTSQGRVPSSHVPVGHIPKEAALRVEEAREVRDSALRQQVASLGARLLLLQDTLPPEMLGDAAARQAGEGEDSKAPVQATEEGVEGAEGEEGEERGSVQSKASEDDKVDLDADMLLHLSFQEESKVAPTLLRRMTSARPLFKRALGAGGGDDDKNRGLTIEDFGYPPEGGAGISQSVLGGNFGSAPSNEEAGTLRQQTGVAQKVSGGNFGTATGAAE